MSSEESEDPGEYVLDSEEASSFESNFEIVKRPSKKVVGKGSSSSTVKKAVQATKWKEEDVIALLEAAIQYRCEKGSPEKGKPKTSAYYRFIKERLRERRTRKQIYEKLRSLKINFHKTKAKPAEQHASPHDYKVFELSEKIWGYCDDQSVVVVVPKGKAKGEGGEKNTSVAVPKRKRQKGDDTKRKPAGEGEKGDPTTNSDIVAVPKRKPAGEGGEKGATSEPERKRGQGERDIDWSSLSPSELQEMEGRFRKKYRHLYDSVDESRLVVLDHLFMIGDDKANELSDLLFQSNVREEKLRQKMRKLHLWQAELIQETLKSSTTV